jgi:hypothetical protein
VKMLDHLAGRDAAIGRVRSRRGPRLWVSPPRAPAVQAAA